MFRYFQLGQQKNLQRPSVSWGIDTRYEHKPGSLDSDSLPNLTTVPHPGTGGRNNNESGRIMRREKKSANSLAAISKASVLAM